MLSNANGNKQKIDGETPEKTKDSSPLSTYLKISVFIAGIAVMSAEMSAPRLLAPSFGTTQIIWTNIIGTVLTALTVGAIVGGRLADRWPEEKIYARVLMLAGVLLALIPIVSYPILDAAARALAAQKAGIFLISLAAVSLFFAPPVFLMGMIGPWAIRLAGSGKQDLGRIAGILSGLSAMGSIIGTFVSSLIALPLLGTRKTLLITAGLLVATGLWRAVELKKWVRFSGIAVILITVLFLPKGRIKADTGQIYETESLYQYLQIIETPSGRRKLLINEGEGVHSIKPARGVLTRGYWDFMSVIPSFNTSKGDRLRVLILGLAGGTMATQIEHYYADTRNVSIDGVEIDPKVIEAGKLYFGLDEVQSLKIHIADARTFLFAAKGTYDLIIVDVYRQSYIPFYMVTREFYEKCYTLLAPHGIFAINLATVPQSNDLLDAFTVTLKSVFPHIGRFRIIDETTPIINYIYLGSGIPVEPLHGKDVPDELKRRILPTMQQSWAIPEEASGAVLFTDDRCPVELLAELIILRTIFKILISKDIPEQGPLK